MPIQAAHTVHQPRARRGTTAQAAHRPPATEPGVWRERAVRAYQEAETAESAALQIELAGRIKMLTGRRVTPHEIYVNRAERLAVANVDGIVFRLRRDELALLRACAECGAGLFESPPVQTLEDLGYALAGWQPRHRDCQPVDPADESW